MGKLNNLRYYSNLYFHGHTVGGTNPSLLEAMASQSVICANNNEFNRAVIGDNALYFSNADDVADNLQQVDKKGGMYDGMIAANMIKIRNVYSCDNIVNAYAAHFEAIALRPESMGALTLDAGQISLVLENS